MASFRQNKWNQLSDYVVDCIHQNQIKREVFNIICIRYGLTLLLFHFFLSPYLLG